MARHGQGARGDSAPITLRIANRCALLGFLGAVACGRSSTPADAPPAAARADTGAARAAADDVERFRAATAPTTEQSARWAAPEWLDPSRHRDRFVAANGQRLQYLDWGGSGPPLLFLPGMGHTAHVFDELAPRFTDRHHVLALTLRGHGASSAPARPYTVDSMATDVHGAISALGLRGVTVAGHSLGGHVANRVAVLYPDDVARVIYLDAAKDSVGLSELRAAAPSRRPAVPESSWRTQSGVRAATRHLMFNFWSDAQEADFRAGRVAPEVPAMVDLYALQDWRSVRQPQLDICALDFPAAQFPWLDSAERARLHEPVERYVTDRFVPWERAACDRFAREAPRGTLVVVPRSNHYVFLVSPEQTYLAMSRWLAQASDVAGPAGAPGVYH